MAWIPSGGQADVDAFANADVDGLLFPKVESVDQVSRIVAAVDASGGLDLSMWLMIEMPVGVLDVRSVAASSVRVECLVMGARDLIKELRARHTESRSNLNAALLQCALAARSIGVDVVDGGVDIR
jgi:citrate lyase subunit beta/citryl-CoA lyase